MSATNRALLLVDPVAPDAETGGGTTGQIGDHRDRRSHPRVHAPFRARLGMRGEQITAAVDVVDLSQSGVLLVSPLPLGARTDDRVLLSLLTPSGTSHHLARVARSARGDDFRSYVAAEFTDPFDAELGRVMEEARHRTSPPGPGPLGRRRGKTSPHHR